MRRRSWRTRRHSKKAKEILRGCRRHLLDADVAQPGDLLAYIAYVRGLIGLATERHRREVRCIGLDEHPLKRHAARHFLQGRRILEGNDPRERDVKAEIERRGRDLRGLGEVQMAMGIDEHRNAIGSERAALATRTIYDNAALTGAAAPGSTRQVSASRAEAARIHAQHEPRDALTLHCVRRAVRRNHL